MLPFSRRASNCSSRSLAPRRAVSSSASLSFVCTACDCLVDDWMTCSLFEVSFVCLFSCSCTLRAQSKAAFISAHSLTAVASASIRSDLAVVTISSRPWGLLSDVWRVEKRDFNCSHSSSVARRSVSDFYSRKREAWSCWRRVVGEWVVCEFTCCTLSL